MRARPICRGEKGSQICRILAPAMASTGTTNTQKYQYSQPTTKPAPWPRPALANSVNERTWGREVAIFSQHAHDEEYEQPPVMA